MYIHPNHKTLNDNVLWHIDDVRVNNDSYHVKGWIAHANSTIVSLNLGDYLLTDTFKQRQDVLNVYINLSSDYIGFEVNVPKEHVEKPVKIVLMRGEVIENVGNLYEQIVLQSGFQSKNKDLIVVDNFYYLPDTVRDYGLKYVECVTSDYHKGKRAKEGFILNGTKELFEEIIGRPIVNWNSSGYTNGTFQYCTSQDPIVYHVDLQSYAAMVYLTPNAPVATGTSFYKSKITGLRQLDHNDQDTYVKTFKGISDEMNFYDGTQFELVDTIGNVYNRLVLFNAKLLHAASQYFGDTKENSRFFHIFFFDVL